MYRLRDVNSSAEFSEETELMYRSCDVRLRDLNILAKFCDKGPDRRADEVLALRRFVKKAFHALNPNLL